MLNLYLISQTKIAGWDTFSDAVVAAKDEESARKMHPRGEGRTLPLPPDEWASDPKDVTVQYLGRASELLAAKGSHVVLASFHAG